VTGALEKCEPFTSAVFFAGFSGLIEQTKILTPKTWMHNMLLWALISIFHCQSVDYENG
jgi:hypothetical protein